MTSASARRDVVKPPSSVSPAAEQNASSKFRPDRKSVVQRPASSRMCWSSSPGGTITSTRSSTSSYAIAGEFVTSVSSVAAAFTRARATARQVEDESRKIVEPERTSRTACAAIAAFAAPACDVRCSHPVGGIAVEDGKPASARAPPCTRSTRPSLDRCSRSRWTVIEETVRSRARSAMETPPSRWMRSRIRALLSAGGIVVIRLPRPGESPPGRLLQRRERAARIVASHPLLECPPGHPHIESAELVDRPHEVIREALQRLFALLGGRGQRVADHAGARELGMIHREAEVLVALELDVRRAVALEER